MIYLYISEKLLKKQTVNIYKNDRDQMIDNVMRTRQIIRYMTNNIDKQILK